VRPNTFLPENGKRFDYDYSRKNDAQAAWLFGRRSRHPDVFTLPAQPFIVDPSARGFSSGAMQTFSQEASEDNEREETDREYLQGTIK